MHFKGTELFGSLAVSEFDWAFIISTGSYHLLSGRYDEIPILDQVVNSMKYYPRYIGGAFFYIGIFGVSVKVKSLIEVFVNRQFYSRAN